jgi:hypothetical protein
MTNRNVLDVLDEMSGKTQERSLEGRGIRHPTCYLCEFR